MKKIKIAHCVCGLDGGVGNVILNYFDHMPLKDYEVHILSNDISSELYTNYYKERGFKIIQIPKIGRHPFRSLRTIKNIMKENDYDIVHCHMTLTSIFPLWSAKQAGVNVRISHSHMVTNPKNSMKDRLLTFINHIFIKYLATDCMACGLDAGKSLFGEKNSFTVLNNAIKLDNFCYNEEIRNSERQKLNINSELVIGNVGRFAPQKNHSFIIDIFYELLKKQPEAKLLLIGEGELYDNIKEKARLLEISEKVIYTGAINDVSRKLLAMDIFLLPSISEGLPVVALEAQAAGLPCVISENVTKEVKVLDEVSYLSLDISPEMWANEILKYKNTVRNIDATVKLEEAGYNISSEAMNLDTLYKKKIYRD